MASVARRPSLSQLHREAAAPTGSVGLQRLLQKNLLLRENLDLQGNLDLQENLHLQEGQRSPLPAWSAQEAGGRGLDFLPAQSVAQRPEQLDRTEWAEVDTGQNLQDGS